MLFVQRIIRVFPRRLTSWGIFNNRLLFTNNRLLFSYCILKVFCGGDKTLMERDKAVMGVLPSLTPL